MKWFCVVLPSLGSFWYWCAEPQPQLRALDSVFVLVRMTLTTLAPSVTLWPNPECLSRALAFPIRMIIPGAFILDQDSNSLLRFHLSLRLRNKRPRCRGHWTSPASNHPASIPPTTPWLPRLSAHLISSAFMLVAIHGDCPTLCWPGGLAVSSPCFSKFTALSLAHGMPPVKGLPNDFPHGRPKQISNT